MSTFDSPEFTKYAHLHEDPQGAGDARPTGLQIVKDNDLEGKWTDKVVLITGTSSGIGIDTVEAMKATGAHVFCTVRDLSKGREALKSLLEPGKVDLLHMDLNSLESVRKCAAEFLKASNGQLNILINNAGVMETPEGKTADGFETQFGTNHLAHFLLFQLVKPALLKSSTPEFNSRVVAVASMGHRYAPMKLENIMLTGEYTPNAAYAHSKTANIWFANYIERHYGSQGLHAHSLHPGGIWTGLQKHVMDQVAQWKQVPIVNKNMKSTAQGSATTVWAAVDKVWEGKGGKYLENCQVSPPFPEDGQLLDMGYEKWAYNPEGEDKLWEMSNKFVGFEE